jgi:membrane-bound PQQ-dependent dehydrogenase (glucose/quinate/shikimate family)
VISRLLLWAFALFLLAVGGAMLLGGARLLMLGGSPYYAVGGLILIAVAILLFRGGAWGPRLYALFLAGTVAWSVYEVGLDGWALMPRLVAFIVIGLWMAAPWTQAALRKSGKAVSGGWVGAALASLLGVGIMTVAAFQSYDVRSMSEHAMVDLGDPVEDWRNYGAGPDGTRFAQLDQITPENVGQLEEVWRYRTGMNNTFKNNPIQIRDKLYICTNYNHIIALNAETGEELWRHDPEINHPGIGTFGETCRGVSYYETPAGYQGECPTRIISGTTDARLIAVDAETGEPCRDFGENGSVDLTAGMGEVPPGFYFVTSPPLIARDRAVVGGWVLDNAMVGEPSGVVRAFSTLTGEFIWAWDMGRPGDNTEPGPGEHYTRGTPNVWSVMSYDPGLDLIYTPTGNATPDYFGAHRDENMERYASSVVALDAQTGAPRWSFQTVHHDIWDYDVPSQPVLLDLPQSDGSLLPALAAPTKRGEIFLLDRRDGQPIADVEELPVPQRPAPEDHTAPTQPFSMEMPHFREDLTEAKMWGITPLDQLWCRVAFRSLRYEGHFTPPTVEGSIQFPGNAGGFNWGSIAADPENGLLIVAPMIMANRIHLIAREGAENPNALNQRGTPYGSQTAPFLSPLLVPCAQPPYAEIGVIDLHTYELLWSRPLGSARETGPLGVPSGLDIDVGVPLLGGPLATSGGLIFHGATMDHSLRAFDLRTGEVLWRENLPGSMHSTPISYAAPRSGRQMIVVSVPNPTWRYPNGRGGIGEADPEGGYVIAYALPED